MTETVAGPVPAYAVGHLRDVTVNADIVRYLEEIDATLALFGGRFLIHGATPTVLEGDWTGDLIVIGFPDRQRAEAWYASEPYQRIVALRAANSTGEILIVDGVDAGHRATDVLGR
jgi:uncharacterized protein (DUF1330 family)